MPRVRAYGGRQVTTAALPSAYRTNAPTAESLGAGLGEQIATIGLQGYAEIQQAERQKADEIALLAADNALATWEAKRIYDPERGALTVKGRDAFGLPETVNAELTEFAGKVAGSLTTERQRTAFARAIANRRQAVNLQLQRHVFSEIQQYDAQETTASVQNATTAAVAQAGDPRAIRRELDRGAAVIVDYARRNGIGPEATGLQLMAFTSSVHVGVIDRLLTSGADRAAAVYYEQTKSQIDGKALAKIEAALEEGSLRGESQRRSDAILATAETQEQALEQARAIEEPKLRDAVEDRVVRQWQLNRQAERGRREQAMVLAGNLIDQRGTVDAVPPSIWTSLTVGEKTALEQYAKRKAGGGLQTDFAVFYRLFTQAAENPQAFAGENLMRYRHQLEDTEFKELVRLQASIRTDDREGANKVLDDFRTETQILNEALEIAGIDPTPPAGKRQTEQQAAVARMRREVADRVRLLQSSTGKKATNADVQAIADDVLTDTVRTAPAQRAAWYGIPIPFLDRPEERKRIVDLTVADVPRGARAEIEAALRAKNRAVTDQSVLDLYVATLRRTGGR